jgi:hypothetical protein
VRANVPRRLAVEDVQGEWEDVRETLVGSIGDAQDALVQAVNGNLSTENTTSAFSDPLLLRHNTETRIKNPLAERGIALRGLYAVRCVGVEIGSDNKPTRKVYSLATPQIIWEAADSESSTVLVTALYDMKHTEPCMERLHDATQSIGDGATIDVAFNTAVFTRGSVITYSAPNFTVSEAGTYTMYAAAPLEGGGLTYDSADLWFDFGGTTISELWLPMATNNGPRLVTTVTRKLAAGATFKVRCFQSNTAPAARNLMATQTTMAVHRLYNDSVPAGRVTLFFFGG